MPGTLSRLLLLYVRQRHECRWNDTLPADAPSSPVETQWSHAQLVDARGGAISLLDDGMVILQHRTRIVEKRIVPCEVFALKNLRSQ